MQAVGYQGSNHSAPKTFRALPVAYELGKYMLGDENAAARVVSKAINVATRPYPGSPDIDRQETQFLGVILQLIAMETHSDARSEEAIVPLFILDFEQRAAIVLRDVMGFSREYAARAMNVSPETYAAFLSEGRRQLRDHLARVGLV